MCIKVTEISETEHTSVTHIKKQHIHCAPFHSLTKTVKSNCYFKS